MWNRLAIETSCEELLQPRSKDDGSYITLQSDLLEYIGVFAPDTKRVTKNSLVKLNVFRNRLTSR